jgi:hypothetical protein
MEEKDIFKFEDFLGGNKIEDLKKMKSNLLKEGLFSDRESHDDEEDDDNGIFSSHVQDQLKDEDEEINQEFNPYKVTEEEFGDIVDTEGGEYFEDEDDSKFESEEYYKLFRDKAEDFVCDIAVEGVNQNNTQVRLIVESDEWNLIFTGEIKNGKCIIPIKKLNILNEGQTGNIKLEVNADGNLFTPWEDKFIIKASKKVSVKLNENIKSIKSKPGVKVNVKRSK